jgi:hypothetical protein
MYMTLPRLKWLVLTMALAAVATYWWWVPTNQKGNKTKDVTVSLEKTIQVPFPQPLKDANVSFMQFSKMDWGGKNGEIAASVRQGPYVFVVDPNSGLSRYTRTSEHYGNSKLSWFPNSTLLAAQGLHIPAGQPPPYAPGEGPQIDWRMIDIEGDMDRQIQQPSFGNDIAGKGVVLPDGRKSLVVLSKRARLRGG